MESFASCVSWIFDDVLIHHPEFHSLMHPSDMQPEFPDGSLLWKDFRGPQSLHLPVNSINSIFQNNNIDPAWFIELPTYNVWTVFWQPLQQLKVPKMWDDVWVAIYFMFFPFWELSQNGQQSLFPVCMEIDMDDVTHCTNMRSKYLLAFAQRTHWAVCSTMKLNMTIQVWRI